jgi:hypothetical protein
MEMAGNRCCPVAGEQPTAQAVAAFNLKLNIGRFNHDSLLVVVENGNLRRLSCGWHEFLQFI